MKKLLAIFGAVLLVASCAKETDTPSWEMAANEGAMCLGIAMQSEQHAGEDVLIKIYKVDAQGEGFIRRYDAVADVPEYLNLLAGDYIVKVQVGKKQILSYDAKYYYGEAAFKVEKRVVTPVTVECKLQTTTVRVEYDATIAALFEAGYATTVAIDKEYNAEAIAQGDVHALVFAESGEGYLLMSEGATTLYWHFEGRHATEGDIVKGALIEGVKPAARYTIRLKYSDDAPGGFMLEATVDESIEEKDDNISFSPDPTIKADGFDIEALLSSAGSYKFEVNAVAPISTMSITADGVEYSIIDNSVEGVTVEKRDDRGYTITLTEPFFVRVAGGQSAITFNVVDEDGGKLHKDVRFNVQGAMPLTSGDYDLWTGSVTFKANVLGGDSSMKLAYRVAGGQWAEADVVAAADGSFRAVGANFAAEKVYEYKLVIDGKDVGKSLTYTTENGVQLPNADFENWHTDGKPYFPYGSGESPFWLTGNEGSASFGGNLTSPSTDVRPGSTGRYSASLVSQYVVIKFAAGNLFTGSFAMSGTNGKVSFGRPFSFNARPKSLTYWMKNNEGAIDKIDKKPSGVSINSGDPDRYTNMVILANWSQQYTVDTANADATAVSEEKIKNMEGVIAYAWLSGTDSHPDWTKITAELTYIEGMENVKPNYVVVSFTPSGYGDFFTGSTKSWMNIDDVRFEY